jgi:hypothetical protein
MSFPGDTYAGAALLIPITRALNLGIGGTIEMHAFDCAPKPTLIALKVNTVSASWPRYPGNLVLAEAAPDLGFFTFIAAPFLPKVHAWFDPKEDFLYVGGEIHHYLFGDARIVLVKSGPPASAASAPSPTIVVTPQAEATPAPPAGTAQP